MNQAQFDVCRRFNVSPHPVGAEEKVGVARNVRTDLQPLNGLRHPRGGDTSGWYFGAGEEFETRDDFFLPIHVEHLAEWCPLVIPYLALPPGWRFLLAREYEDAWFDETLLDE